MAMLGYTLQFLPLSEQLEEVSSRNCLDLLRGILLHTSNILCVILPWESRLLTIIANLRHILGVHSSSRGEKIYRNSSRLIKLPQRRCYLTNVLYLACLLVEATSNDLGQQFHIFASPDLPFMVPYRNTWVKDRFTR